MNQKPRLYIAAPLFNGIEREFNLSLAEVVERKFEVFLPQRDGGLLNDLIRQGVPPVAAEKIVFEKDVSAIERVDVLVAVLDGAYVDEGVAFEIGYAFARHKVCFGLQTDMRRQLPTGNNPMISASLTCIYSSLRDLVDGLNRFSENTSVRRLSNFPLVTNERHL